ncbi:29530_t:CDS:2 [Gigaspora margarita]|uniref:29530_t:CDS:1 n=1 Tax=Gigaspora margarita TaxID=4874 RepID=A0ABN7UZN5_GIGMA|nr:29530_t:CDS:2 [Gigaspora margarita]
MYVVNNSRDPLGSVTIVVQGSSFDIQHQWTFHHNDEPFH